MEGMSTHHAIDSRPGIWVFVRIRLERSHSEVVPGVGLVVGGVVRLGLALKTTGLTKKLVGSHKKNLENSSKFIGAMFIGKWSSLCLRSKVGLTVL